MALLSAAPAVAQDQAPPDANARVHFGPLAMTPTIGITNIGVDNNVFYEPDVDNPKSDFTMTLEPATDMWLHLGRAWLAANTKEDLVYYQTYANQRSANNFDTATLTVPLNRLTFKVGGSYANTFDRPGYEISARIHHIDTGYNAAIQVRVLSKTSIGVRGEQRRFNYDNNPDFLNVDLRNELNMRSTTGALTVRHQLTPLTALTLDAGISQDRFDVDQLRNADTTQVSVGVEFDPAALLKGSAQFGYQNFKPLAATLPAYSGSTMTLDLSYVALGSTKLSMQATRGIGFSFDINQPYYIQTGVTGSIAQQIYGPFDVTAQAGIQRLAYQDQVGALVAVPNEVDYVHTYGGGAGYHMGQNTRIGFNVSEQRRTSANPLLNYHGLVAGMSVTYGS